VNPTIQLLLAVLVFREPFGTAQAVAFALIGAAVALYLSEAVRRPRDPAAR
jgi:chloramphenicol-sensitive protein RarD